MADAELPVAEPLVIEPGQCPRTASGALGIVMLHVAGSDDQAQWFIYRAGFFQPPLMVRWPLGTMHAVLLATDAEALISKRYARAMTESEAQEYNDALKPPDEAPQEEPEQRDAAESRPARRGRHRKGD